MQFDFSKLRKPYLLDLFEFYLGSSELDILEGSEQTTLIVGGSLLFMVEDGVVHYVGGAPEELSKQIVDLILVKLQSAVTLECTVVQNDFQLGGEV